MTLPNLDPEHVAFLRQERHDLAARMKVHRRRDSLEHRLDAMERHKQKKAGTTAALEVTLTIPRRRWPAAHQAAIDARLPLMTHQKTPGTRDVILTTTRGGALHLRLHVPELHHQGDS